MSMLLTLGITLSVRSAGVPQEINYQGKVEVNGVPYSGVGQFKFAIVDATGTTTTWSNDGSSTLADEPTSAVALTVYKGVFSVRLGDISRPNMTQPVTPAAFDQPGHKLAVWFSHTGSGFQRLNPDQPLASVPYAMMAQTVPDNSINGWKLQRESVWPEHEGRSNTIVSYFASYNLGSGAVKVGTVPTSKTFVITDIVFGNDSNATFATDVQVEYIKDSVPTVLYRGMHDYLGVNIDFPPVSINLRAGLPVPGGAELYVKSTRYAHQQTCILSGFEFEN
ncbi:hypothetical protein ACFL34_03335 [Candidatus Sumerlaeota bacterium]